MYGTGQILYSHKSYQSGRMNRENTTCWLFLLLFCFEFTSGLAKITGSTTHASCKAKDQCILLTDCKSYMDFIKIEEKPLKPPLVEFLREKQCGFHEGYPKVCCSGVSRDGIFSSSPRTDHKRCSTRSVCIPLKECKPYVDLVGTMEKPLKSLVVEFLRAQQCGFKEGYPTVCCSPVPETIKALIHAKPDPRPSGSKKHNKLSAELDIKSIFDVQTTKKPLESSERRKEKAEAINKAFHLADFFDFTGSFDFLRRKRFDKDNKLDLEIR